MLSMAKPRRTGSAVSIRSASSDRPQSRCHKRDCYRLALKRSRIRSFNPPRARQSILRMTFWVTRQATTSRSNPFTAWPVSGRASKRVEGILTRQVWRSARLRPARRDSLDDRPGLLRRGRSGRASDNDKFADRMFHQYRQGHHQCMIMSGYWTSLGTKEASKLCAYVVRHMLRCSDVEYRYS